MTWEALCFPGQRMLALPDWENPRLYFPAERPFERWRKAALYPAFRVSARLYRLLLQFKVVLGRTHVRTVPTAGPNLGGFLEEALPEAVSAAVLVGTPGPAQKYTVALWDGNGNPVGYLKYGEAPPARARISREFKILSGLPQGVGPRPLKMGPLGAGLALLMTPVSGRRVAPELPPSEQVLRCLDSLPGSARTSLEEHPWIDRLLNISQAMRSELHRWLEVLPQQDWKIVNQHGDFAPWNLLRNRNGAIVAVDWEHGDLTGFPHIDLAYYILQVGALIRRWSPERTLQWGSHYLSTQLRPRLAQTQAESVLRLAACHSYFQALNDGHSANAPLQVWRQSLWSTPTCGA